MRPTRGVTDTIADISTVTAIDPQRFHADALSAVYNIRGFTRVGNPLPTFSRCRFHGASFGATVPDGTDVTVGCRAWLRVGSTASSSTSSAS